MSEKVIIVRTYRCKICGVYFTKPFDLFKHIPECPECHSNEFVKQVIGGSGHN